MPSLPESEPRVFRVTVRGKFADLTERARRYLADTATEHTRFQSAYTPEGTFVYDAEVRFLELRYEVRAGGDAAAAQAADRALEEAETFLSTMGFGHGPLDVAVVDLATMWQR